MLPQWWAHRVAIHLLSDLWSSTFHERVPLQPAGGVAADWPRLRELFIALLQRRARAEIDLWPSQIEAAARAVDQSDDLVVSLPTSAGKTRIAELCILRCLAGGKRVVFVTPLRALSAQTETTLQTDLRPARQDDLGPLRQHRRQRLRRGRDPRARHRRRDAGEARLRASQRSLASRRCRPAGVRRRAYDRPQRARGPLRGADPAAPSPSRRARAPDCLPFGDPARWRPARRLRRLAAARSPGRADQERLATDPTALR